MKTQWFVERLKNMSTEKKKDFHATVRFFSEIKELAYEDDYAAMYAISNAVADAAGDAEGEIDSGIAEVIGLYIKRSLELSDINLWEPCEPMTEEEQALSDEHDQIMRGEFV